MGTRAARHRGQRSVVYGLGFVAVLSAALLLSADRAHAAGVQLVDQSQHTTNRGTANANSGGNRAVGNNSVNTASGNQRAFAGGGGGGQSVANNSGASRNASDGSASINTGDAGATGTSAHTTAAQTANTAGGGNRGVDIVDQTSRVDNAGAALARTGNNAAIGNNSDNLARSNQLAVAGRGNGRSVANNSGATSNDSDGRANITTGDADATGVDATTNVDQTSHGRGDGRGGVSIVDQTSSVDNRGAAAALTGDNRAIGNNSFNTATANGTAFAGRAGRFGRSVANNSGGASNHSDGTATITSGDADATGVDARTTTSQSAFGAGSQNGVAIVDENAPVTNRGSALARSGGNRGVGNNTDNLSRRFLRAFAGRAGFRGRAVTNNSGAASNHSDGTTRIVTGDASAIGTLVRTVIRQLRG